MIGGRIRTGIRYVGYSFGEEKVWYRTLPGVEDQIRALDIPDDESLWQWGYCRRSSKPYRSQLVDGFAGAAAYLSAHGITPDTVIGCGPTHGPLERFFDVVVSDVLPGLGADASRFRRVVDRECVNVLQAIADARALLEAGHRHVLVLACERLDDDRGRFRKYATFSDFCLSLLLSADLDRCAAEVLDVAVCPDPTPRADTSGVLVRRLETECVADLLRRADVAIRDVRRLFYLNMYVPIAVMKAQQIGFAASQVYTDATVESGHCYGADPFINLQRHLETGGAGGLFVLCASSRGHAGAALIAHGNAAC